MSEQSSDMALPPQDEQNLVAELTRQILADTAPEEMELFAADEQGWLQGTRSQAQTRDEMLGFGTEIAVLLTPYVISALTATVRYLAGLFGECAKAELRPRVAQWIRRLFGQDESSSATELSVAVPTDLVRKVHEITKQTCLDMGLAEPDAAVISDAVAGRLVVPA